MKDISVIVPIYNGLKYIPGMIDQVKKATRKTKLDLELLFVNDKPDEPIGELDKSSLIDIRVIETNHNRGIHGTRIYGLNNSKGKYVLFLDQDDFIYPDYFLSQMSVIGDSDAVLCDIYRTYKSYSGYIMPLCETAQLDTMISVGNNIFSPGQVIIKRDSIPQIWINNALKHNGSDDWFLWICMLKSGCVFAINQDVLFEHNIHENNSFNNKPEMLRSTYEVQALLYELDVLSKEEMIQLNKYVNRLNEERLHIIENSEKKKAVYRRWIDAKRSGYDIGEKLVRDNVKKVAIYGCGEVGIEIYNELKDGNCNVTCFVDRYVSGPVRGVDVLRPSDRLDGVDALLISLVDDIEEVKCELRKYYSIKMYSIVELV